MIDFIVLGLPRSATTWLANWLTTNKTLCLHDPFAVSLPEHWPRDGRRFGISCTGAYLMPKWLDAQTARKVVITRDPAACDASLEKMGLPATSDRIRAALDAVQAPRVPFADLWTEAGAAALWALLLPGIAFDATRWRQLKDMKIEPRTVQWNACVACVLQVRGWLVKED